MVAAERAEALDVLVAGFAAGTGGDVIDGALGVDRVVEDDGVDDQAERIELFFLAVAVGLAELAAAAVADVAGEAVAAFAAVELDQDAAAEVLVVAVLRRRLLKGAPPDGIVEQTAAPTPSGCQVRGGRRCSTAILITAGTTGTVRWRAASPIPSSSDRASRAGVGERRRVSTRPLDNPHLRRGRSRAAQARR